MTRTEFGAERTECACSACRLNCQVMPGYLIPADLRRMMPPCSEEFEVFCWAEGELLASMGAIVSKGGRMFRIPTLVPAVKADGSCIHFIGKRCVIHEVAPFGCAFFDCGPDPRWNLSVQGLSAIQHDWRERGLYARLWEHLWRIGKRQQPPEVLRKRMQSQMGQGAER